MRGRMLLIAIALATVLGCAGYKIGTRSLYRADIKTIHVPIIKSESFRPELGVMLTETVQKEIERRTSFKLSNIETADSVMKCTLTADAKRVVSETNLDEPRLLQSIMTVEVAWFDRRGMPLIETRFLPPGETTFYFSENVDFVPEAGQSISTANQRVVERLANHIVDQMEARW
ncbi:MAG: LPS assembly lipoprotein LptE [Planctomycetota bacterium]|nr:LPS assembly lipoprotein LptE [Planctomycetota bacterium]